MQPHSTILFLGVGNMGHSLIEGLLSNGYVSTYILAADHHSEHLQNLANEHHIRIGTNNEMAKIADVIVFAVKPQNMQEAVLSVREEILARRPLLVSIAAGIRTQHISKWLGHEIPIVRAMPNTPAMLGSGATALYATTKVSNEQRATAESIMRAVGMVLWLDHEADLDSVTALSGSGPAYFFLIMQAMQEVAVELGLKQEVAKLLTIQTALGAARMALESPYELETLRHQVTSRGGTTERALQVMEEQGLREIIAKAVIEAKNRAIEISELFGESNSTGEN